MARNSVSAATRTCLHNQDMGGVKLVGPIPEEVQNYTMYFRCPHRRRPPSPAPARAFLAYLETPEAQAIFTAPAGVVPVRDDRIVRA